MKRIIIILVTALLSIPESYSQGTIDSIVSQVVKNNALLKAFNYHSDAQRIGNRTELLPYNPEVSFNYLWGSPSEIGNRKDFSLSQTFDFPSAYVYKKQISRLKNEYTILDFEEKKSKVILQTKLLCIDMIYHNAMRAELKKRLSDAEKLERSYKLKLESGDCSLLEYNKVKLYFLNAEHLFELHEIEKFALLEELSGLNGNSPIIFNDSIFPLPEVNEGFDDWYKRIRTKIPELKRVAKEKEISERNEKLELAMNLPKIETGYMSENVAEEQFQGLTLGISIPLWENRNKTKYIKLKTEALQAYEDYTNLALYNHHKKLYNNYHKTKEKINEYEVIFDEVNNSILLLKALEKGEISMINYLTELSYYYESINSLFEMKRKASEVYVELNLFN